MADKKLHLQLVAHNESLLEFLSIAPYPDWVATVTFYAALHCVQAYLLSKRPPENPHSHVARDIAIDNDPFLNSVRNCYRDLQDSEEIRLLLLANMIEEDILERETTFPMAV